MLNFIDELEQRANGAAGPPPCKKILFYTNEANEHAVCKIFPMTKCGCTLVPMPLCLPGKGLGAAFVRKASWARLVHFQWQPCRMALQQEE